MANREVARDTKIISLLPPDTIPSQTTKTIGEPKYGEWITTSTPITLTATDPGENPSGVKEIHYIINGTETVVQGNEVTFTFDQECEQTLEFWAVDNAGNEENHTIQTHYVDSTPPIARLKIGFPRCWNEGMWWVNLSTLVHLRASDILPCTGGCGVGLDYLYYEIWWDSNKDGEIDTKLKEEKVYDDTVSITFKDESLHQIRWYAKDLLGNKKTCSQYIKVGLPPDLPSDPSPGNGAFDVPINTVLSWKGTHPEGKSLTYDVYLGIPPKKVASNLSSPSFDPGTLEYGKTYFWKVIAWDSHGSRRIGRFWRFSTEKSPYHPPYPPNNPNPENGASNVAIDIILSWSGGDSDGDPVTYDVYFGMPPKKVASNIVDTTFDPGILEYGKTYFWRIIAWDNTGLSRKGPLWRFETEKKP
jgi:hypothetical protein